MTRLGIMLAAALAIASPASAQTLRAISNRPIAWQQSPDARAVAAQRAREHQARDDLNLATWVYLAAASADWSATAVCAQVVCFDEHSYTGLFLYGVEKPKVAIPLGLAIDAVWVVGIRELVAPDHPTLARALLYGSSAARLVFTVSKITDLRAHTVRVR